MLSHRYAIIPRASQVGLDELSAPQVFLSNALPSLVLLFLNVLNGGYNFLSSRRGELERRPGCCQPVVELPAHFEMMLHMHPIPHRQKL